MEATRRLSIELSEDMAEAVSARVASGEFASESEVVQEGLRLLEEQDEPLEDEVEAWLGSTIPARVEALDAGRVPTKGVDDVRASLARRAARD